MEEEEEEEEGGTGGWACIRDIVVGNELRTKEGIIK